MDGHELRALRNTTGHTIEAQYLDLLATLLEKSRHQKPTMDRTGVGTWRMFDYTIKGSVYGSFPLLTTKRVWWRAIVAELLWFLSGDTNEQTLAQQGITIWKEWAREGGELGPVYGAQWRSFGGRGVDQVQKLIEQIKGNPASRRQVVSAWNPLDIDQMALPPCHMLWQTFVDSGFLSLKIVCRSSDVFLGLPFNIASYALLLYMLAHVTGLKPGELVVSLGDVHMYTNHVDQVTEQLQRSPMSPPTLTIQGPHDIDALRAEHILLTGYHAHGVISGRVAV